MSRAVKGRVISGEDDEEDALPSAAVSSAAATVPTATAAAEATVPPQPSTAASPHAIGKAPVDVSSSSESARGRVISGEDDEEDTVPSAAVLSTVASISHYSSEDSENPSLKKEILAAASKQESIVKKDLRKRYRRMRSSLSKGARQPFQAVEQISNRQAKSLDRTVQIVQGASVDMRLGNSAAHRLNTLLAGSVNRLTFGASH